MCRLVNWKLRHRKLRLGLVNSFYRPLAEPRFVLPGLIGDREDFGEPNVFPKDF